MATMAIVQPELGRTVYICLIQLPASDLVLFFQRRPRHTLCETDLDGLAKFWANTFCLEASQCATIIPAGFWQNTIGPLSASHFQTQVRSSTGNPDHIVQNQPSSSLVLVDCQVLPKQLWAGSKPVCKNHLAHFWANLDQMRIGSGMFTGNLLRLAGDQTWCQIRWSDMHCELPWRICRVWHHQVSNHISSYACWPLTLQLLSTTCPRLQLAIGSLLNCDPNRGQRWGVGRQTCQGPVKLFFLAQLTLWKQKFLS